MRRNQINSAFTIISLFLLPIGLEWQLAVVANTETISQSSTKANRASEPPRAPPEKIPVSIKAVSCISFEKTVCDLGDVGQGTKNTCEFRFTNTGRGLLKIGNISRTCGCTVFHLDAKGSIICADRMLYCYSEKGTLALVEPRHDHMKLISSFKITKGMGEHWAHPVVCNGRLYIRHGDVLMAFDIKKK
jgi:hypothetical protein